MRTLFLILFMISSCHAAEVTEVTAKELMNIIHSKGTKATLVNMWASWCPPCRKEFPDLVRLAHAYQGKGLRFLLVCNDSSSDLPKVKEFLTAEGVDFPTYIKAEKPDVFIKAIDQGWSGALPTTFIYDANGTLVETLVGAHDYDQFEKKIVPLLN